MAIQIQLRRGTAAEWAAVNPILAHGELGLETDTRKSKIGDGVTAWGALLYAASVATGASVDCGNCDLSTNLFPDGPGAGGTAPDGSVLKGNFFENTAASTTLLGPDGGPILVGAICRAKVNNPGQVLANWAISYILTA